MLPQEPIPKQLLLAIGLCSFILQQACDSGSLGLLLFLFFIYLFSVVQCALGMLPDCGGMHQSIFSLKPLCAMGLAGSSVGLYCSLAGSGQDDMLSSVVINQLST